MKQALILFAHGSRDPEWSEPFRAIQREVAARCPDVRVALAFLESMSPTLEEALEALARSGHTRIAIAPLFMAPGGHLKRDVPRLLEAERARHPGLALTLLPTIGEAGPVLEAIGEWLAAAVKP